MSHRNQELPLWDFQAAQQRLSDVKDELYTPMRNNEVRHSISKAQLYSQSLVAKCP